MSTIKFNNVYIKDYFTVVGPKEKNSKLVAFDVSLDDYYYKSKTFEMAEVKMQRVVIENLITRNNLCDNCFDYLIGGDLINQISISSYNAKNYRIPFIGVYAACATFPLELILGGNLIDSKNAKKILCVTSSHNLTAERQFRFPTEYGNTRPSTATSTATSSVGAYLSNEKSNLKITSGTIGKVVDLGVNDVNHMGAVMAPACADTLHEHLTNLNLTPKDYDLILTGDLGCIGLDILKDYYNSIYGEKLTNIMDSGCEIYLNSDDTVYSGGSGPCCLPLVFFCRILKSKKYKKILLLGTGSLHNSVMVNQHQTIPSVSHAVSIEVIG